MDVFLFLYCGVVSNMNKIVSNLSSLKPADRNLIASLHPNLVLPVASDNCRSIQATDSRKFETASNSSPTPPPTPATSLGVVVDSPGVHLVSGVSSPAREAAIPLSLEESNSPLLVQKKRLFQDDANNAGVVSDSSTESESNDKYSNDGGSGGTDQPVCIKNDETTVHLFEFLVNGNKSLKTQQGIKRKYWKCKVKGCKAKYTVSTTDKGSKKTEYDPSPHNHPIPEKPRTRKEVKEKALEYFKVGVTPSVAHKRFVNDAPTPLSSADVPSKGQLKSWKHRNSMASMPSGDVFLNISQKHPVFTRLCVQHPDVQVCLASDFGLRELTNADTLFTDGTFRTTECGLVLTVLLALRDTIAIPCAYLLHKSRETSIYESFFKTIKKAAKLNVRPKFCLLDFEEALADGFHMAFPDTTMLKDLFHFKQANIKHLGQLGLKFIARDISADLTLLWDKPTKQEFDTHLDALLNKWDKEIPKYASYFRSTWLGRYPPPDWASYARPSDAPSGSAAAEGYNARLDKEMPRATLALDKMVDFLAEEDKYWTRIANDERLWAENKTGNASARVRNNKRRRLAHYRDRSEDTDRRSVSLGICDLTRDEEATGQSDAHTDSEDEDLTSRAPVPYTNDGPNKSDGKEQCSGCKRRKIINQSCSLHACKRCCIALPQYCTVYDHRNAKKHGAPKPYLQTSLANSLASSSTPQPGAFPPPILPGVAEKIDAAMKNKRAVFISYNGGSCSTQPRKILPREIIQGKDGPMASSHCYIANKTQSFYLYKMLRVEDYNWTNDSSLLQIQSGAPILDPLPASVEEYLKSAYLEQHWDIFKLNGFDTLDALLDLNQDALNHMNIPIGHQGRLLRKANKIINNLK